MIVNLTSGLLNPLANQPGTLFYKHPDYLRRWWWREFGRVSYVGGQEYHRPSRLAIEFEEPIIVSKDENGAPIQPEQRGSQTTIYKSLLYRFSREKELEYWNRQKRAYYQNYVRTIANMLVSHAMKQGVTRDGDPLLMKFWEKVDQKRTTGMDSFVRAGLRWAQVKGIMWACVDVATEGENADGQPYVYWVSPLDILDWEVDEYGEIVWLKQFVYTEAKRTWRDAVTPVYRFRIWQRDRVDTYQTTATGNGEQLIDSKEYGIKRVPFVPLYSTRDEEYTFPDGQPLLADFCKGCNDIYNKVSLLNEIIYKQTFSWLIIPDKNVDILQAGTGTALGWDATNSGGAKPEYIAPDPEQARVIMESIASGIEQLRQSVGVGRGRQEGSMQKSSGDAMELESEDKRSILGDIASAAEDFEKRLVDLVFAYRQSKPAEPPHIQYPTDFDLRSLQDDIDEALSFRTLGLSPEINLELTEQLVRRKFSSMPAAELDALVKTLEKLKLEPPPVPGAKPEINGAPPPNGTPPGAQQTPPNAAPAA